MENESIEATGHLIAMHAQVAEVCWNAHVVSVVE